MLSVFYLLNFKTIQFTVMEANKRIIDEFINVENNEASVPMKNKKIARSLFEENDILLRICTNI